MYSLTNLPNWRWSRGASGCLFFEDSRCTWTVGSQIYYFCLCFRSRCLFFFFLNALFFSPAATNVGSHRRQIPDLLDQSIQISSQCFVITADNRFILLCGFWDKSFRVYSTDTGTIALHAIPSTPQFKYNQIHLKKKKSVELQLFKTIFKNIPPCIFTPVYYQWIEFTANLTCHNKAATLQPYITV